MRGPRTVRNELRRVINRKGWTRDQVTKDQMYGAEQALAWVLQEDAAAPSVLAAVSEETER